MTSKETPEIIVVMDTIVADALDDLISGPFDALIAIGQVRDELPQLHRQRKKKRFGRPSRNSVGLYRALIDWCGVGIDYVEHSGRLHVLEVWYDDEYSRRDRMVDCKFQHPANPEKYIRVTGINGGVSVIE